MRFINPAADQASRTVSVIAAVDNADGALKSGLFAKGEIVIGERRGVLRVPRSAIVTWDPAARAGAVFAVEGGRARRREVTTGAASPNDVEIVTGIVAGDTLVTRGGFDLKEGDRVAVAAPTGG